MSAGRQRISYAQNGEDVRAWRALRHVEHPFYVEVGASHPLDDSLTAALSAEGWRGVLVEADPDMAALLRQERPGDTVVAAAAHSAPGLLVFAPSDARGQGTVAVADGSERGLAVPAVRVADVLAGVAPEQVHFVSVDVEGHEREALLGLDLQRWRPWVLCIEATAPDSRELVHQHWEDVVLGAGYVFVAFDGLNRWYVEPGHTDLAGPLAAPFNVLDRLLDGWERRAEAQLAVAGEELGVQNARLSAEVARLEIALALERERQAEAQSRAGRLEQEVSARAAELDAVRAREAVVLASKSWRLTAPLRTVRWRAGLALAPRAPAGAATALRVAARPGDDRRWQALRVRLDAARARSAP